MQNDVGMNGSMKETVEGVLRRIGEKERKN